MLLLSKLGHQGVGLRRSCLAVRRGDDKMLKKTEGKIVEHMIAVEKMVDGAKADIRNSRCAPQRDNYDRHLFGVQLRHKRLKPLQSGFLS